MRRVADVVVIGGGVVGAAIAYGLAGHGMRPVVLDEGDSALRASRVNFGLVWLHSKGAGMPEYGFWTRRACDLWPEFAQQLQSTTGIDTHYVKSGGLSYCLGEAEYGRRTEMVDNMRAQADRDPYETRMLTRSDLNQIMPRAALGPEVLGASFGPHDGHVNPLNLLRALHTGLAGRGASYHPDSPAVGIEAAAHSFVVATPHDTYSTPRVVLAAGHGSVPLMSSLGFDVRIRAERGQQLVTERCEPVLPLPANGIRQSAEGTILIGSTQENVGYDVSTTVRAGATMAARALRILPALAEVKLVRTWAGVRTLTEDKCPVYEESARYPGAFLATCHSGVTLAAVHATDLADAIYAGQLTPALDVFHGRRFQ